VGGIHRNTMNSSVGARTPPPYILVPVIGIVVFYVRHDSFFVIIHFVFLNVGSSSNKIKLN
jgi:hypothetical protein